MIIFALTTNIIVTSMLLLGGASTIEDLTGMSKLTAGFLIPILSCWIYTMYGGLRATFFASYVHTTVIFVMLLTFTFAVYSGSGEHDLWGSPSNVYTALEKASVHGFFDATYAECSINGNCGVTVTAAPAPAVAAVPAGCPTVAAVVAAVAAPTSYMTPTGFFDGLTAILLNDGQCFNAKRENTGKACGYTEKGKDNPCCDIDYDTLKGGTYCRATANKNCISTSADKHFESEGCGDDEICVTSFLTMGSTIGLIFGITNIVGNFGTVFVDQSYWQSAVAAKPRSAVVGFLIGGMVWFAVPFCMATTNGLAGRALTVHPDIEGKFGAYYIDGAASSSGLTPARVLSHILGPAGAFILLLQLFMAITSTGSAEIIAVSSILTYDIYYEYINPELKGRREKLRRIFYTLVQRFVSGAAGTDVVAQPDKEQEVRLSLVDSTMKVDDVQKLLDALASNGFFEIQPSDTEVTTLSSLVASFALEDNTIFITDLYSAVNKAVSSNNIEGAILLRVSKFFTGLFAVFMGFLAVFLLTIGLSLGHVYMSMGCLVGSAVGPAALTILMETANSKAIAAGAIGGFVLAMIGWTGQAASEFGEVKYGTIMSDWPWVAGNLCGILGGTAIAMLGSLMAPDKTFKWSMLNDRIALVDDVEPPKHSTLESGARLEVQVKIAVYASIGLTIILLVLWPIPMHVGTGVLSDGGFGAWVAVEIIWALVGGLIIIIMPAIELIRTFTGGDKAVFKQGAPLKVEMKMQALGQGVFPTGDPSMVKAPSR
jgi:Na+/proline symporter